MKSWKVYHAAELKAKLLSNGMFARMYTLTNYCRMVCLLECTHLQSPQARLIMDGAKLMYDAAASYVNRGRWREGDADVAGYGLLQRLFTTRRGVRDEVG